MRVLKFMLPGCVLLTGLLIPNTPSLGKPEDTKKTRKPCAFCHVSGKDVKELTDAGKYYKEKKTLEGYGKKEDGKPGEEK